MKKAIIIFMFLLFIVSCSNEQADSTTKSKNDNESETLVSDEGEVESDEPNISDDEDVTDSNQNGSEEFIEEESPSDEEKPAQLENPFNEELALSLLEKYNGINDSLHELVDHETYHDGYGSPFHNITTKQEVGDLFEDFIDPRVVISLWDERLIEAENQLYVIPTDSPPDFDKKDPYQIKKEDSITYKLINSQTNKLHGTFKQIFTFSKKDSKWIISGVEHDHSETE
ncbi:hypothetical protein [Saliterribacillus persicus]|nr:hypothetical protein [Saliterribacillus persicus]